MVLYHIQESNDQFISINRNAAVELRITMEMCIRDRLKDQGKKVILAAADTFRAAAIEQLTEWSARAGVDIIAQQEGSDPAAVIYDACLLYTSRCV